MNRHWFHFMRTNAFLTVRLSNSTWSQPASFESPFLCEDALVKAFSIAAIIRGEKHEADGQTYFGRGTLGTLRRLGFGENDVADAKRLNSYDIGLR